MKTIIYSLLAVIIFGIVATGFTREANVTQTILVQTIDAKASPALLTQSAEIISKRLKSFSDEKFDITTNSGKNQIQVKLSSNWNIKEAEKLIVQQGKLEFYETFNNRSVASLLKDDGKLLSLLQTKATSDSSVKIGCISTNEMQKVNEYLNSLGLGNECKFVWDNLFENESTCLYVLKDDNGKGALLKGSDIESFKYNKESASNNYFIEFTFKQPVKALWADITRRNINNSIAIVLDNNVLCAPIVRSVIEGGKCVITGDFTQNQVKYIVAIGSNGELPVGFKVVK